MIIQKIGKDLYVVKYAGQTRFFKSLKEVEKYRKKIENEILQLV